MNSRPLRIIPVTWVAALALVGCLLGGDRSAGRGSEVENQVGVYGIIVDSAGTGAAAARVEAIPTTAFSLPGSPVSPQRAESTLTDSAGRYSFRALPAGVYNLIATRDRGRLTAMVPAVAYGGSGTRLNAGRDTLRHPGGIAGKVTAGGAAKPGVIAYVPGTSLSAFTGDDGVFLMTGVPRGIYSIRYMAQGLAALRDTGIRVRAGEITRLPDRELGYDTALPPPAPTGLRAAYDTAHGIVRLAWNGLRVGDLLGYLVYRDRGGLSSPEPLTASVIAETLYSDTLPRGTWPDSAVPVFGYHILSVDSGKNQSLSFSDPVQIAAPSPSTVAISISLAPLIPKGDTASIGDTVRLVAGFSGPAREVVSVVWRIDGSAVPVKVAKVHGRSGRDTLGLSWVSAGVHSVRATVIDAAGDAWEAGREVSIQLDPPKARAGSDTVVSVGDKVELHGRGSDRFGLVDNIEWDIGALGFFRETATGDTSFIAPASATVITCVLRVTDDDGVSALDTMKTGVILDAPVAAAGPDRRVSIRDTVMLAGSAWNRFGSIVKWEWDAGGKGDFLVTGPGLIFTAPDHPSDSIPCILRVTDEDGFVSLDTLTVTTVQDIPIARADADPPEVRTGEAFTLSAAASSDGYGRLVKWEWDIGNTGRFVVASGRDTVIRSGSVPDSGFACALRVTDDDGLSSVYYLRIPIRSNSEWVKWASASPRKYMVNVKSGTALGQVWLMGDYIDFESSFWGLHSSGDLLSWGRQAMDFPAKDRSAQSGVFEFQGRARFFVRDGESRQLQLWGSADGTDWVADALPSALANRTEFSTAVFGGKIWLYGGVDMQTGKFPEDAWSTSDGLNWIQANGKTGIGGRVGALLAVKDGKLWLMGGAAGGTAGPDPKGIWRSADGAVWTRVTGAVAPAMDGWNSLITHGNALILAATKWDETGAPISNLYVSLDGVDWRLQGNPAFPATTDPSLIEWNGKAWIISGEIGGNGVGSVWLGP